MVAVAKLFILLCLTISTEGFAWETALEILNNGLKLGNSIVQLVNTIESQKSNPQLEQKIIGELSNRIDAAKNDIINSIELRSKLEYVDKAKFVIKTALEFVKDFIEDDTSPEGFKKYFESNVKEQIVILKELLTYVTMGTHKDLITLLSEEYRCSGTKMNSFRQSFYELSASAAALEMLYTNLTANNSSSIDRRMKRWTDAFEENEQTFKHQSVICDSLFSDYIQSDLDNEGNATALNLELSARYPNRIIDIFFWSKMQTCKYVGTRRVKSKDQLFREQDPINKALVVSGKRDNYTKPHVSPTKQDLQDCLWSHRIDDNEEDAACNIRTKIVSCDDKKDDVGVVLVYFESTKFPTIGIFIDKDSPVIKLTSNSAKMGSENGRYRVFVYPQEPEERDENYIADGAVNLRPGLFAMILAALSNIVMNS